MKMLLLNNIKRNYPYRYKLALGLFVLFLGISCSEDTVDFEERGVITGTVLSSENQEPLANVEISTNPSSSTVFTDDDGAFILNNILVDSYAIQAERNGFDTDFESVIVVADSEVIVSFQLDPTEENNLAPSKPELIFPLDNANDIDVQVTLAWDSEDPEDDPLDYSISLRNGTTSEIEIFEVAQDTTLLVTNLSLSTTYFWQVSVSDEINEPVSSNLQQFTTLDAPSNPILFVREENGNNVIFSGAEPTGGTDINVIQITDDGFNSFNPRKNNDINRIAFLRTVTGNTHLFTMALSGEDIVQVSDEIPVAGFRVNSLRYTWYNNGAQLLYPNFDKLVLINANGSGSEVIYTTPDGSFISEVASPEFDSDILILKTNNPSGYDTRIFTYRISTETVENVILENESGASGSIDVTASGDQMIYFRDLSGAQNDIYRIFEARLFNYDISTGVTTQIETEVITGENDLEVKYIPSEGGVIFTRVLNNNGATPNIFVRIFDDMSNEFEFFTNSFSPDWE